jgi:hypothetical protein
VICHSCRGWCRGSSALQYVQCESPGFWWGLSMMCVQACGEKQTSFRLFPGVTIIGLIDSSAVLWID